MYGVEVRDNCCCRYQFELKTQKGIFNRLVRYGLAKKENGTIIPINNNKFVVYSRVEYKNKYDKSAYTKVLDGGHRGSWEF